MSEEKKRFMVYMPIGMIEAIKRLAAKERRSTNQEILRAIEEHLKRQEGQSQ
jgi:hypothetical protein